MVSNPARVRTCGHLLCSMAQVLMIDRSMFLQLAEAAEGSAGAAIAEKMRERAEARQRRRLNKAIEMAQTTPLQRIRFRAGEVVIQQVRLVNLLTRLSTRTFVDCRCVHVRALLPHIFTSFHLASLNHVSSHLLARKLI